MSDIPDNVKQHGNDFLNGCENAVNCMRVSKGENAMVIGNEEEPDFIDGLEYFCKAKGATVKKFLLKKSEKFEKGEPAYNALRKLIKEFKPDVAFFPIPETSRWPSRINGLYQYLVEQNSKNRLTQMPHMSYYAVSNFLSLEPEDLNKKTQKMHKIISSLRGKEIKITTKNCEGGFGVLTAEVPPEKVDGVDFLIMCGDQVAKEGSRINLPGGEVFFQPYNAKGEITLCPGSIIGLDPVLKVKKGIRFVIQDSKLMGISSYSNHDQEIKKAILDEMRRMKKYEGLYRNLCELGIGTHDKITLENCQDNPLLIEKVGNTFHVALGKNLGYGNCNPPVARHFDCITRGKLEINGKTFVDSL